MSQISDNIIDVCQSYGMQFRKQGGELYASCPFHADGKKPNFRVTIEKNVWFCDACDVGGGVVEFIALKENRNKKDVYKELVSKNENSGSSDPNGEIVSTYDYTDALGNLLYQVCRFDPKDFRQRRPDGKGGWIWKLEGCERVLYHLPEILSEKAMAIWVVEGEKDVETLRAIRQFATTNVGGAKKWADAYSETLRGKEVLVCGDNDEAGREHVKKLIPSLEPHAKCIRHVKIPGEFKDVSDFRASFNSKEKFAESLQEIVMSSPIIGMASLPVKSMSELESDYVEHVKSSKVRTINLGAWLPSLSCVRSLVAGELVSILGDTGTAKTYVLQHIAYYCRVPTLLFEMELPGSLTFERFVGVARRKAGAYVFATYENGHRMQHSDLAHVYTCTKPRLTAPEIESIILKSELKIGVRPVLVEVDYAQLARGEGKSRYERISNFAEEIKVVAKNTGTIIVLASQVGRDKESPEVTLHDAKDSGSIENSSGVVIGMWRDPKTNGVLCVRVLKNTKGKPSRVIRCNIEEDTMWISERSEIDENDVPNDAQADMNYNNRTPYPD